MSKFGEMVKKKREEMEISQRTLSFMTGITNKEIARIEIGYATNLNLTSISNLCNFLGLDLEDSFKAILEDRILLGTIDDECKIEEEVLFKDRDDLNVEDVLGIYSTAYLLKVSPGQVCDWIESGEFAVTTGENADGGRQYYISDSNIIDFAKTHKEYYEHIKKAGLVNDPICEDKWVNEENLSFDIWLKGKEDSVMVNGNDYEFSADEKILYIYDKSGCEKCVFMTDNLLGFQVMKED